MSDIVTDRLEPTAPVIEPAAQEPRREPGSESRRRQPPPPKPEPEAEPETDSDDPPHQIDSLA